MLKYTLRKKRAYFGGIKMISTSSHKNWQSTHYRTYTITEDKGKSVNYEGESYPKLAPSSDIIEKWNNNKGVISDEENNKMYTEE